MRPLRTWPAWLLEVVLRFGIMRGLWSEVWIEKHYRAQEELDAACDDASDDFHGPFRVGPILGMH
jgi:hypothetical protein